MGASRNRKIAAQAARREGIDVGTFLRQMRQEAHFQDLTSPAGAQGPAQIMPGTAKAWGVRNVHDPVEAYGAAAKAMAKYLHDYGSWAKALTAYNAGPGAVGHSLPGETRNYIQTILGGKTPTAKVDGEVRGFMDHLTGSTSLTTKKFDSAGYGEARKRAILGNFIAQQDPNSLLIKMGIVGGQEPVASDFLSSVTRKVKLPGGGGGESSGLTPSGKSGRFKITGPNPGRLKPYLVDFAEKVAGVYGRPLTGSDGTGHSYLTVNGNVSQHSTGEATDIPASGATLTRMGQAALIAAGMPPAQAKKQKGGLFNVNGHQIIFNTMEGGNHYTHLHISAKRRAR